MSSPLPSDSDFDAENPESAASENDVWDDDSVNDEDEDKPNGELEEKLLQACLDDDLATVESCLSKGANVNACDIAGNTALIIASMTGCTEIVEVLIKKRADLDASGYRDQTALMRAIWYGFNDIGEMLIKHGADGKFGLDERGRTALSHACENGTPEVVELLLDKGADVDDRDFYGKTGLMYACEQGRDDLIEILLRHGAYLNERSQLGRTPLYFACENGHIEVVRQLVEAEADVNAWDRDWVTPLMTFCGHHDPEIEDIDIHVKVKGVNLLIHNGAKVDKQTKSGGSSAAMMTVMSNNPRCLLALLTGPAGLNLDLVDKKGETVFSYAIKNSNTECLKILLEDGRLLMDGVLKSVHKDAVQASHVPLDSLLVTVAYGVFSWDWCLFHNYKAVSLAALESGLCPGEIRYYYSNIKLSPLILSILDNDEELMETLLKHLYYFPKDYIRLSTDKEIRRRIHDKDGNTALLERITHQPLSLVSWSALTVSNSISKACVSGNRYKLVDALPIPQPLKSRLKFM